MDIAIIVIIAFIIVGLIIGVIDPKAIMQHFRKNNSPKGTLHILRDDDGTYMSLELNDANSLSEIESTNQVIFTVKVHDTRSR